MKSVQFLIEEYKHFSESFWKNEELGERRLNFYMTLYTAVLAGIVGLITSNSDPFQFKSIVSFALLGVLIFGIFTYLRMIKRDKVTEEYKRIIKHLRQQIWSATSEDASKYSLPFNPNPKRILKGGLVETVSVMNSLLIAIICGLWIGYGEGWVVILISFLIAFGLHIGHAWRSKAKTLTQSFRASVGALITNGSGKVLAFERRDHDHSWQLPQGGIEEGEEPEEAIYRELEEETGLKASALGAPRKFPGLLSYELPKKYRTQKTGRGQTQYWYAFDLKEPNPKIKLGEEGEFQKWMWMDMEELISYSVEFRVEIYRALKKEWFEIDL